MYMKRNWHLITVPKLHCNPKYRILRKVMWMAKRRRQKYKPLQSIYNFMHGLEQVTKGVMQKQPRGKWEEMQKYLLKFYIKL